MSNRKNPGPAGDTVFLVSLGCSKNLVDTEVIAGTLLTSGRTLVFTPEEANLYIINTCAFIPAAREEALAAIREGIEWKRKAPGRRLVAARMPDRMGPFRRNLPGVSPKSTSGPASIRSRPSPICSTAPVPFPEAGRNRPIFTMKTLRVFS